MKVKLSFVASLLVLTACGGDGAPQPVAANTPDSSEPLLTSASALFPTGEQDTVRIQNIRIGQTCQTSSTDPILIRRADFSRATQALEVRIYKEYIPAFRGQGIKLSNFGTLGEVSFYHNLLQGSAPMQETTPACKFSYSGLKADILQGTVEFANLINEKCPQLEQVSIADDVNTSEENEYWQALLAGREHYPELFIDRVMPYAAYVVEPHATTPSLDKYYFGMKFGLLEEDGALIPVLNRENVESAITHWEGFLGFVYNGATNRRCDYQRLAAAN